MDKSHVSMEAHICIVCGQKHQTNAILLRKDLRQVLDRETVTGWGMCPDCESKLADDRIALVEVEARADWQRREMKPDEARRTGRIAWMKRDAFRAVFNTTDLAPDGRAFPMIWVEDGTIAKLEANIAPDDTTSNDEG